ncbi:MAG: endonuclease domain-containing protein, partial [Alphaproteobacteria bacterium]
MTGTHFRRQVPIGHYIADFACMKARLVIEIDGEQHALGRGPERDAARSDWLESQGFKVIRLWNHDVLQHTKEIAETILLEVQERSAFHVASAPPTLTLPTRGRE